MLYAYFMASVGVVSSLRQIDQLGILNMLEEYGLGRLVAQWMPGQICWWSMPALEIISLVAMD